jgi:hypothetical protein
MASTGKTILHPTRAVRGWAFAVSIALWAATFAPQVAGAEAARLDVILAEASRSSSGPSIDRRLIFAKAGLLRTSYNTFRYLRRYPLKLTTGKPTRLALDKNLSIVIEFRGFVGSRKDRMQYYLETYWGKKRQAGVHYSVSKGGAPAITGIDQPGKGRAYVIIVRAPK